MKIHAISNPVRPNRANNVGFGRKLKEEEKPQYTKAIHDALDYLGVKNLSMIVHGSSFPSEKRDTAIGSPYSKGAGKFVDFLKLNGFNSVQLGPGGTIGKKDSSPYISTVFAKNELFIDLEPLKSRKYAHILSDKTYDKLTTQNKETKDKNYNYTDFGKAFGNYEVAMDEAYSTFKSKVAKEDSQALKLNKEFSKFKTDNKKWVENDGLYKVLTKVNGSDDYEKWNDVDKTLPEGLKQGDEKAKARYDELTAEYADDIDKNSFIQFIADKQMKENNQHRKSIGFNYIGDLLVGFNKSDVWTNQGAFLKDWKLGCPFGGAGNGPQAWGIPVLDPKKLFNKDGSLGESGKVLKEKIAYSLKNFDNVRVDHALGLVDPYIYKENTVEKDANGAIRRDKLWANNISHMREVDPSGNFRRVLKEIVLPTFEEYGVDKNEAVWEDLCSETHTFQEVYRGQEKLPGITQTQWKRAENCPEQNWSLVGSHDSEPASLMIKSEGLRNSDAWNVDYLSGFLNPDPATQKERQEYKNKISTDNHERVKAKFTELFRGSKNLQMMFVDFFGIDKVYNYGGQDKPTNWKLRVDNDFEDDYYRALQDENSYAMNMPEILAQAVKAKAGMEVAKNPHKADALRNELNEKLNPLLSELDKYKNILKEKEGVSDKVETKVENKQDKPEPVKPTAQPAESPKVESDKEVVSTKVEDKPVEKTTEKEEKVVTDKKTKSEKNANKTTALIGLAAVAAVVVGAYNKIKSKIKAKKAEKLAAQQMQVMQQAQQVQNQKELVKV